MNINHDRVYCSAAIELIPEIRQEQIAICEQFQLIPRPELHLTFGFIGGMSEDKIAKLGQLLTQRCHFDIRVLNILGVGGAFKRQNSEAIFTWDLLRSQELSEVTRVCWWTVEKTDPLNNIRTALFNALEELGLNSPNMGTDFFPHLTLGSNGPATDLANDYSLWDVHTVAKVPNISKVVATNIQKIPVAKIHITSVSVHPASLYLLYA
jgi:2'-5' RNA ligase